jgi:dsbA-like thioredoxin domain-containing protein
VEFAKQAGVPDIERFRTDMNDSATVTAVEEATQHARDINIQGTPFLIVNEAVINGYRPADYVRNTIAEQAANAS